MAKAQVGRSSFKLSQLGNKGNTVKKGGKLMTGGQTTKVRRKP